MDQTQAPFCRVEIVCRMFTRFASFSAFRVAAPALILAPALLPSPSYSSGEDHIPSLNFGWSHHGALASFDYASIRRGFQVYRQVCASCHSVQGIAFRSLVGVTHDEAAMKKIAETYEIVDGYAKSPGQFLTCRRPPIAHGFFSFFSPSLSLFSSTFAFCFLPCDGTESGPHALLSPCPLFYSASPQAQRPG